MVELSHTCGSLDIRARYNPSLLHTAHIRRMRAIVFAVGLVPITSVPLYAQTNAALQGFVFDVSGAVIPRATISVHSAASGPPGNLVGSPTFGQITRTRLATGEAGSSRQIQLAVKAYF